MKHSVIKAISEQSKKEYKITWHSETTAEINGKPIEWDIKKINNTTFHILKNNKSYNVEILKSDASEKHYFIKVNGEKYKFQLKDQFDELLEQLGMDNLSTNKISEIKAPMPGVVIAIETTAGQSINKGDTLLILEAMKMENAIKSPTDGIIKEIKVKTGDAIEKNQILITFE